MPTSPRRLARSQDQRTSSLDTFMSDTFMSEHKPALIFAGLLLLCLSMLGITIARTSAQTRITVGKSATGTGTASASLPSDAKLGDASTSSAKNTKSAVPSPSDSGQGSQPSQAPQQSSEPNRVGGPDAYGYVYSDDRDPGGPVYSWIPGTQRLGDSAWTEVRTTQTTDPWDDGVITYTLPFAFPFYGSSYSQVHVSTNGNLHFGLPNDYWPQASNLCIPSNSAYVPQAMIAPIWYDFVVPLISDTIHPGGVYTDVIGTAPNRIYVVEWRNVYDFSNESIRATMEALIHENGEIDYQYQSFNGTGVTGSAGVVGIQNATGTVGLPYLCYQDDLSAQRAIRYAVRQDVFLQPGPLESGGAPGSTISYVETVRNQTGINNSFALSVASSVWTTTVTPANTGLIPSGGTSNVTVRVQIPPGTALGTSDTARLNVSSDLPTPGAYTDTAVITTTASTQGVDFTPPASTKAGDYGSTIVFTSNLINRSGQDNRFDMALEGVDWSATIVPTVTGLIGAEASTPITITVHVPSDAVLAASDVITVTATGQQPSQGQFFGQYVITATAGIWIRKTDMLMERSREAAVTFPPNGHIYVIGGEYNNGNTDMPIQEYNPLADTWSSHINLDTGVSNVGAGAIGNVIYIPGGYSSQLATTQSTMQAYYPLENRVDTITTDPLPAPRFGAGVAVYGNKLYVIGGSDDTLQAKNSVYEYDPARAAGNRWQTKASMPTARVYLAAAAVDGKIYAVGGIPGGFTDLKTAEAYNPATNTWSTVTPMSVARGGLTAVGVNTGSPGCGGYLYAIGGGYLNYTATAERYDPAANSWQPISSLSLARRTLAGAYSPNTYSLIALGGWNNTYENRTEAITCAGGLNPPTATATSQPTPSSTPGSCAIQFDDVPQGSTFYSYVHCLACQGIITGYNCGGAGEPCNPPDNNPYFRLNNSVTRGQLSKIVSEAASFTDAVSEQTFTDIPTGSTFYTYTARLVLHSVMSGYACGGVSEPCDSESRPYFRPNSGATRGQLTKIVSNAAGYNEMPVGQTFEDVAPGSDFYTYTQRLTNREIMGGYNCGGAGEPCVPPADRPYFRPSNAVTRGQTSKIVGNTFFPDCNP